MKKINQKTQKPLVVTTETLRRLDLAKLAGIVGGAATSGPSNCHCSGWGCP